MNIDKISQLIINKEIIEVDCHHESNKVLNIGHQYILKISDNLQDLRLEYEKEQILSKILPSSKPVCYEIHDNKAYYLKTYIEGESLISKKYLNNPFKLIDLLVEGIKMVHQVQNISFKSESMGDVFIHGDCCLPNFIVKDDKVVGIIDCGSSGLGDPYYDYAWALWSLEFNLKTNQYNHFLIEALDIDIAELNAKRNRYLKMKEPELWDLYNHNMDIIKTNWPRGTMIKDGLYHLYTHITVKHNDGSYLLMQRDFNKTIYPGCYEMSAGGSALKGEDAYACARRELFEETGIYTRNLKFEKMVFNEDKHGICYYFICVLDIPKEQIVLQPGETVGFKWVFAEELINFEII